MIRPACLGLVLLALTACATSPQDLRPRAAAAVPDQSAILAAADASRGQGRYGEALQIYQEILLRDAASGAAQYGAAECLLGLQKPGDAKAAFDGLAKDALFRPRALQGSGLSLLVLKQRDGAETALREAVAADPNLWRSWNALGMIAGLKEDWSEAQADFSRALAIDPASPLLHNNLGYARLRAGQADAALSELRKALEAEPGSETIRNNLRLALASEGNYRAATQGVTKEEQAMVLNNVGFVAMQRGDLGAAEGYLARAMESSSSYNTISSKNIEALQELRRSE